MNRMAINHYSRPGNKLKREVCAVRVHQYRTMIVVESHLTALDWGLRKTRYIVSATYAIHKVHDAVPKDSLVGVIVASQHDSCTPRRVWPAHPCAAADASNGSGRRMRRMVRINKLPTCRRSGESVLQPFCLDRGAHGAIGFAIPISAQHEKVDGTYYKIIVTPVAW